MNTSQGKTWKKKKDVPSNWKWREAVGMAMGTRDKRKGLHKNPKSKKSENGLWFLLSCRDSDKPNQRNKNVKNELSTVQIWRESNKQLLRYNFPNTIEWCLGEPCCCNCCGTVDAQILEFWQNITVRSRLSMYCTSCRYLRSKKIPISTVVTAENVL